MGVLCWARAQACEGCKLDSEKDSSPQLDELYQGWCLVDEFTLLEAERALLKLLQKVVKKISAPLHKQRAPVSIPQRPHPGQPGTRQHWGGKRVDLPLPSGALAEVEIELRDMGKIDESENGSTDRPEVEQQEVLKHDKSLNGFGANPGPEWQAAPGGGRCVQDLFTSWIVDIIGI